MANTFVKLRLHEQREYPSKILHFRLKKGTIIEELNWSGRKTEKVTIFRRFFVKNFKWKNIKDGKKEKRQLTVVLKKDDMKKQAERKLRLIRQIVKKQYPLLSYSFFNHLLDSTTQKIEISQTERKIFLQTLLKILKKQSRRKKIKEIGGINL